MPELQPDLVTATTLGAHLGLSRQRVVKLAEEGVLTERGGRFDQDACRLAYLTFLRDGRRENTKTAAATALQEARAEEVKLRTARIRGELLDIDTLENTLGAIVDKFRAELAGVATAAARDRAARAAIERVITAAVERLAIAFQALSSSARSGGAGDVAAADPDA